MKTKPLWPLTYVRAARWLDCDPRTVSRLAQGRKVTFSVFRDLIHQRVGNAGDRWRHTGSTAIWYRNSATVRIREDCMPTVGTLRQLPLLLIREDFHGIEGKQAPLDFQEIAKLRNLTIEEVEAAIAFPW